MLRRERHISTIGVSNACRHVSQLETTGHPQNETMRRDSAPKRWFNVHAPNNLDPGCRIGAADQTRHCTNFYGLMKIGWVRPSENGHSTDYQSGPRCNGCGLIEATDLRYTGSHTKTSPQQPRGLPHSTLQQRCETLCHTNSRFTTGRSAHVSRKLYARRFCRAWLEGAHAYRSVGAPPHEHEEPQWACCLKLQELLDGYEIQ